MKGHPVDQLRDALQQAGVRPVETLLFNLRAFGAGPLQGSDSSESFCGMYLEVLRDVLGPQGTLVVPTFTQQVGAYGETYDHETTPTVCGVLAEYVRRQPGAVRSLHPVFSLAALGPRAHELFDAVSPSGFGWNSGMHRLYSGGGRGVSLGFAYHQGFQTFGVHLVETLFGVPYFYNKILQAPARRAGKALDTVFTLNVRYRDFEIRHNFTRYVDALRDSGGLAQVPLGNSVLYSSTFADQLRVGFELLERDVYAFLDTPPVWRQGEIPLDGPPCRGECPGEAPFGMLMG